MNELLSILELTKSKYHILDKLAVLEINQQTSSKEYFNYLELYKKTCFYTKNRLKTLSEEEKSNMLENMKSLNPFVFQQLSFSNLLDSDNQYIILHRVVSDLNDRPLFHACMKPKVKIINSSAELFKNILEDNEENENNSTNEAMINHYISQDFVDLLLYVLEKKIQMEEQLEIKEKLIIWKYRLIFLSSSLEYRMFMFDPDLTSLENIKLTDNTSIKTTGITVGKYIKLLDDFIVNWMSNLLEHISSNHDMNDFLLEEIILETLSCLLHDKEYIDILNMTMNQQQTDESEIVLEKITRAMEIINQSKDIEINTKTNRQYVKI